jgi:uncharacterized protein YchJ
MKEHQYSPIVDQPELSEPCPCKSGKRFGACCGYDFDCDCKSKLMAIECCYLEEHEAPAPKKVKNSKS